ncbi:hypothetical protein I8748_32015 [Nostoc sp. CENA67]|uniref:Uncharacterized protein n=1 Tax=Amazonocrinis nigriterrae CENA67 TaxID=2794033 RepID=A0A8J7LCF2_9NOST|nr:hypothetical protein [Amazonocrinis nigriterrae]MBH8566725.1 hypothetical protein [Amazonocrinis nigriterrae CENA67]
MFDMPATPIDPELAAAFKTLEAQGILLLCDGAIVDRSLFIKAAENAVSAPVEETIALLQKAGATAVTPQQKESVWNCYPNRDWTAYCLHDAR